MNMMSTQSKPDAYSLQKEHKVTGGGGFIMGPAD